MKKRHSLNRILLVTVCAVLSLTSARLNAGSAPAVNVLLIQANAGTTATLVQTTSDPYFRKATAVGVVQSGQLGTCIDNAELDVRFPVDPVNPVLLTVKGTFTSINGTDSLSFTASGSALPDPASPYFYNVKYSVTITGGTGKYASAKGLAQIDEVVMFTSDSTATAAWNLKGFVITSQ